MLPTDWDDRMERAVLKGVAENRPTLAPFLQEALDDAKREYDESSAELDAEEDWPEFPMEEEESGGD